MSLFKRSTSNRSESTSSSRSDSKSLRNSKGIIISHETTIDDFQGSIDNWEIPKVHKEQIYQISKLNFLRTDYSIKTEERDIQLTKSFETIHLFSEKALKRHRENGFKYIHISLVQVGIKPLSKEGLNTSILAILRDTRFKIFEDSLLSSIESSLCTGPVSFDCYPNFTVSLKDKNILKSLVLQVKTHNYEMIAGSIPIAIIFRVHYKAMMSAFSSKVKISSKKGETLLLQTDLSRSNSVIPKSIQWKEINLPDEWVLEGVVQPKPTIPNESLEPNTRLKHIEQFHDGKVKLSFIRNHHKTIDDYTCESSSLPETIDLGRVSQLAQDFSRMENCPKFQPRFSTSDIPNSVLRNVDFRTQIPKPVYKAESSFQHNDFSPKSEPTSPTFSAVTDNMINELNVLEKDFQIDKEFLRDEFYSKNNTQKRLCSSVKIYQETNKEFIRALQSQLSKIDIGENSTPQESDIPDTPTSKAQINTLANESYSSETSEQNSTPEINRLGRENHQDHQIISAPDLDAVKTDEDNVPILDNFGNPQQDAVATIVIVITLHFIGDPSVLKDKNAELLSNLKCKRLSDFQWYKNTFLIRVLLRTQIIDYDDFTYGELISIVQQEGLKICSFCRQFEIDPSKNSKSCIEDCSNSYYSKNKPRKYSKTYRNHKSHENSWQKPRKRFTPKEITNSKPFYKNLTCFKCNKKGHTSKFCRFNRKIQELGLGEELSSKISNLLLDHLSSSSNAFWNRKQHIVDLPYEGNFNEKEIPTKARPIQMNSELEKHCRKEISDLLNKGLISKSRSPWILENSNL
ncbi:hypothetical protein EUTSA_v10023038mg [Eutrema salsugineum]|uniref:CCHC-type domain-containing protein n=1 Tax=Eutrema salsugineum TaxID=72664 RepID=V4M6R6_EUTSA|nr:hypothetical protein EUTSA_v10023038mg [Eutrema salsugineum]